MVWPQRAWVAGVLLAFQLVFPGAAGAIWLLNDAPPYEEIDWGGTSPAVRALDALLVSHFFYALTLVAVMRGWWVQAVGVGVVAFSASAVVNFLAYFHVSGVYF